jgi:hypothetical protein
MGTSTEAWSNFFRNNSSFFKYKDFINTYIPSDVIENNVGKTFLIDESTRAFTFLFTLFFPNSGNWMNLAISIEVTPTGFVQQLKPVIRVFNPDVYSVNSILKIIDIMRTSIIGVLVVFLVLEILEKVEDFKVSFFGTLNTKMLITIYLTIAFLINFYLKFRYFNNDYKAYYFVNKDKYIDTFWMAYYYNQLFFIESLLFAGISIKILDFLRINNYIKLFFTSFDFGYTLFLRYMTIVMCTIIFFTIVGHILWGPFMNNYLTVGKTLNQLLLFTMGVYDTQTLLYLNSGFVIFYFILLFFFMLTMMASIFISLYMESLRKAVTKLGYPEDHEGTSWGFREFIVWLCYCVGDDEKKRQQRRQKRVRHGR